MSTVAASVPVLRWAAQRARLRDEYLAARFSKWPKWHAAQAIEHELAVFQGG